MKIGFKRKESWVFTIGLFLFVSCNAQPDKANPQIIAKYVHVAKSSEKEPLYTIHINSSACGWDVRLNDVPIQRILFKTGGINETYSLNGAILQSGEQELKIRVYPLLGKDLIRSKENFKFEVLLKDALNPSAKNDTLIVFPGFKVAADGVPYLEYTKKFKATVPYTLDAWQDSENLSQFDRNQLNDLLWRAYLKIEHSIKQNDVRLFSDIFDVVQKNGVTANYLSYNTSKENYEDRVAPFLNGRWELEPILKKDFQCHFFANGKIVAMEKLVAISGNEFFFSPIITKIPESSTTGNSVGWFTGAMFHLRKGSKELEVIWE